MVVPALGLGRMIGYLRAITISLPEGVACSLLQAFTLVWGL